MGVRVAIDQEDIEDVAADFLAASTPDHALDARTAPP